MNTGDRIKQRRLELGLTADELANRIKKSRATIYRYENGDIENMPTTILEPLARALYTTPADLMGWEQTGKVKASASIDLYNVHCNTEDECNLILSYRKLNDINKKKCSTYTNSLLASQELEEELIPITAQTDIPTPDESDNTYQPTTIAAHFDGDKYTDDEMDEIHQFTEFVKNRKKEK